jgi:hypothetical protein
MLIERWVDSRLRDISSPIQAIAMNASALVALEGNNVTPPSRFFLLLILFVVECRRDIVEGAIVNSCVILSS